MSRRHLLLILLAIALLLVVLVILEMPDGEVPQVPSPTSAGAGASPPPQSRADVHLTLGNPSGAVSDFTQPTNYLISRAQYALAYHRDRGTPIWASWHLAASDLGTVERYAGQFITDTSLPAGWYQVQHRDYSGSGYDRGHMVPSADRTLSAADNEATFILTNIVPQAPANNQGPWADLEDHLRNLVRADNEAYIIAGPQGTAGVIANGVLTVPAAVWKVAVVLPAGDNDLARVTRQTAVIAVLMPNDAAVEGRPWEDYETTVGCIEALTGLDLLAAIPDPVEIALSGTRCPSGEVVEPIIGTQPAARATQTALSVRIARIEYNPPGDDLAGEYVLLQNVGGETVTLTGWTLVDEAGTTYIFPEFALAASGEVQVWVQSGSDAAGDLYWGRAQPVWNNAGDTAILRNAIGVEISRFSYP